MTAADIMEELIDMLVDANKYPRIEVKTAAGIADVVTETTVYQVVGQLYPEKLTAAIEIVVAQRQALGVSQAVVVGKRTDSDISAALEEARRQNVTVRFWGEHA